MIYLRLFYEFFKTGLFSVGGGLATIPFLREIGLSTGWYDEMELANMIAISESTPGPLGVNMASYVGFTSGGVLGSVLATLALILPSLIVILLIAKVLEKFRNSTLVESLFFGLRPASVALIAAAGIGVAISTFFHGGAAHWPSMVLALAVYGLMNYSPLKKLHPIAFIAASAVVGIVFQF